MSRQSAMRQLQNQFRDMTNNPLGYFKVELKESNIFEWFVYMKGPGETAYEGGIFKMLLTFPEKYPFEPPSLAVISDFWHPNVYPDGKVCISILHPPGEDRMSGERPEERWLPVHTPETILLSVMSMLADPNCSSPANVDSSVEFRRDRASFNKRVKKLVEKADKELPEGFVMPEPKKRKAKTPTPIGEIFGSGDLDDGDFQYVLESDDSDQFVDEDDDDDAFEDDGEDFSDGELDGEFDENEVLSDDDMSDEN